MKKHLMISLLASMTLAFGLMGCGGDDDKDKGGDNKSSDSTAELASLSKDACKNMLKCEMPGYTEETCNPKTDNTGEKPSGEAAKPVCVSEMKEYLNCQKSSSCDDLKADKCKEKQETYTKCIMEANKPSGDDEGGSGDGGSTASSEKAKKLCEKMTTCEIPGADQCGKPAQSTGEEQKEPVCVDESNAYTDCLLKEETTCEDWKAGNACKTEMKAMTDCVQASMGTGTGTGTGTGEQSPAEKVARLQAKCMGIDNPPDDKVQEVTAIWSKFYEDYSEACTSKVDDLLNCAASLSCENFDKFGDKTDTTMHECDAQREALNNCDSGSQEGDDGINYESLSYDGIASFYLTYYSCKNDGATLSQEAAMVQAKKFYKSLDMKYKDVCNQEYNTFFSCVAGEQCEDILADGWSDKLCKQQMADINSCMLVHEDD